MLTPLVELQQQNDSIGRVKKLKSALRDKNQIPRYLDRDEKKRAVDQLMISNKKLREDSIAEGKNVDEKDYAAVCQALLQKRSDIETNIEAVLKVGDEGAFLRRLEDAEQRRAEARANSVANKSVENGTSP